MSNWFAYQLESSVETAVAEPIKRFFLPESHKFHTGGREDIDVRMLGKGRPFVVELISPKLLPRSIIDNFESITSQINSSTPDVQVNSLSFTDKECFEYLSEGAEKKVKAYCAVIYFSDEPENQKVEEVNKLIDIKIRQMTPLRVLHRRTLMAREKIIHRITLNKLTAKSYQAFFLTSAGTYVKEFVHGDLERTTPNIGSLLGLRADIIQLDVLDLFDQLDEESNTGFDQLVQRYSFKQSTNLD